MSIGERSLFMLLGAMISAVVLTITLALTGVIHSSNRITQGQKEIEQPISAAAMCRLAEDCITWWTQDKLQLVCAGYNTFVALRPDGTIDGILDVGVGPISGYIKNPYNP